MSWRAIVITLVGAGMLIACGGDEGEPLRSGSLTALYAGTAFTPSFGYATVYQNRGLIALGDGPIHCGTESSSNPPTGTNAILFVPTLAVGSYSSVFVQMLQNNGSYESVGTNTGTVMLTTVSADAIAGSVSFDYTDMQSRHFKILGSFEVRHCAP